MNVRGATSGDSEGGVVFDIQRWSTRDGPGIRTTIFFKGCPLRCPWCCNPESWSHRPRLHRIPDKCRNCGACLDACPGGRAHPLTGVESRMEGCTVCGACASVCPCGARELVGRLVTVEEVLAEVARDRVFHRRSGGGVTFSGGEPTGQPRFLESLAARLGETGTRLVLETCGFFDWSENARSLARMDLVYLDLKHLDDETHARLTGRGNRLILENAARIVGAAVPLVIRVPLIPGANDAAWNLRSTGRFVAERLGREVPIEIMPCHRFGVSKRPSGVAFAPPAVEAVERARLLLGEAGARVLA